MASVAARSAVAVRLSAQATGAVEIHLIHVRSRKSGPVTALIEALDARSWPRPVVTPADAQALLNQLAAEEVPILAEPFDGPFGARWPSGTPDGYAITIQNAGRWRRV